MEYKIDCKSVGARIKTRKMALQMTVNDLHEKSGVPEDTINNIVYGRTTDPRIESLARIAAALDTTLDYIVFGIQPSAQIVSTPQRSDVDERIQSLKEYHAREVASLIESHERYIEDMKEAHEREVVAVRDHTADIRRTHDFWRALSCALVIGIFVLLGWFV